MGDRLEMLSECIGDRLGVLSGHIMKMIFKKIRLFCR